MTDWVGYRWLAAAYGADPVQPFRVDSQIARSRSTVREEGYVHEYYVPAARPDDTFAGHLAFALRHEGVHLEFLSRLFAAAGPAELEQWIVREPTGQYARRAGFFYEWLTGQQLDFAGVTAGNYVNALDEDEFLTAAHSLNNPRWRVRDNLPGTRGYCPVVARTAQVRSAEQYDCARSLQQLEQDFGADLLMRSAVWLTIKESRASFAIEHEEKHVDRIQRFAAVMERRCGAYESPLLEASLTELQAEILGERATRYGVRRSPVFVGEVHAYTPIVHYVAPHWDDAPALLAGLREFDARTRGRSSVLRAAVLSFGFVYIHPMADGNGRISRFLVNDVLRRDGAVPPPFILPISATITASAHTRRSYDQVLEVFSKPLMDHYRQAYRFGQKQAAEDGVVYDIQFDAYADALSAWRYPDLTAHAEYLGEVVRVTIEQEMRDEAGHLRALRLAREGVKNWLEGPDADIDRIIRAIRQNGGQVSGKLAKEFPALQESGLAEAIAGVIAEAFGEPGA